MTEKKYPDRQRKIQYKMWLLEEEFAVLEAKADEAGMSKAQFLRNMIMFGAAHERTMFTQKEVRELLYELNRIGNNINQIAYNTNYTHSIEGAQVEALKKMYHEMHSLYGRVITAKLEDYFFGE